MSCTAFGDNYHQFYSVRDCARDVDECFDVVTTFNTSASEMTRMACVTSTAFAGGQLDHTHVNHHPISRS